MKPHPGRGVGRLMLVELTFEARCSRKGSTINAWAWAWQTSSVVLQTPRAACTSAPVPAPSLLLINNNCVHRTNGQLESSFDYPDSLIAVRRPRSLLHQCPSRVSFVEGAV